MVLASTRSNPFTFHSDSIMTLNQTGHNVQASEFTFHSDSIMTNDGWFCYEDTMKFTFHSDSIMTRIFLFRCASNYKIYISL